MHLQENTLQVQDSLVGNFFVYPFQNKDCLWNICEEITNNKFLCRTSSGCFMGKIYDDPHKEAIFDRDNIKLCSVIDKINLHMNFLYQLKRKV